MEILAASKRLWATIFGFIGFMMSQPACGQDQSIEYAIKATYLNKFMPFIEWPAGTLPAGTINLCVIGNDPVTAFIDRAASDQRVGDRRIVIRHLTRVTEPSDCQMMYIGSENVRDILALVRGKPVLTITNDGGSDGERGIINFVIFDNRVRFDIDNQAAQQCGLMINSKLLSLAIPRRTGLTRGSD